MKRFSVKRVNDVIVLRDHQDNLTLVCDSWADACTEIRSLLKLDGYCLKHFRIYKRYHYWLLACDCDEPIPFLSHRAAIDEMNAIIRHQLIENVANAETVCHV
jgi:hypothetical protein